MHCIYIVYASETHCIQIVYTLRTQCMHAVLELRLHNVYTTYAPCAMYMQCVYNVYAMCITVTMYTHCVYITHCVGHYEQCNTSAMLVSLSSLIQMSGNARSRCAPRSITYLTFDVATPFDE